MARPSLPSLSVLWRGALRFVDDLRQEWSRARVGGLAAEIAFFGLLGLFPAVIVFAAALGSLDLVIGVGAAADTEEWLLDRVAETFGRDNTLRATIEELFDRSNAGLITAGVLITVYASSRGFTAVVGALDVTYGHEHRRSWFSTRVTGFVLTLCTLIVSALVAAMVVVGPLLGGGEELAERLGAGSAFTTAWVWFRWPVVFVVVVCWAASLYHFAPRRRTPWRTDLPGAVVGTIWWLTVSLGFRVYLDAASSGVNAVFGLLGGALSLLIWLYLLAMGLLVGAEINSILNNRRDQHTATEASR
ncbi:MAG: YihY/virulence factor BrkB family protein [Acidimicrobiaceae bacterium]|nr:YihY/virulence factor BrkB family protein [Acidimicrobiaceae bacterium]MDE0492544.1 YihY/virulence factor BrkB family protein [Acidimicrobiaceae bacterium]MDE0664422.1 YihY/virulence factor BrkB family protein [Acidimicrobiaceae bacterium]MXW88399.1 YihY/virulence factor BrkB family protein [Acidimicrobiaceae bacterium]MXY09114.1 YihY/virulence factor BrkB family protein [Acidimicrobiaceae bacterium]